MDHGHSKLCNWVHLYEGKPTNLHLLLHYLGRTQMKAAFSPQKPSFTLEVQGGMT